MGALCVFIFKVFLGGSIYVQLIYLCVYVHVVACSVFRCGLYFSYLFVQCTFIGQGCTDLLTVVG